VVSARVAGAVGRLQPGPGGTERHVGDLLGLVPGEVPQPAAVVVDLGLWVESQVPGDVVQERGVGRRSRGGSGRDVGGVVGRVLRLHDGNGGGVVGVRHRALRTAVSVPPPTWSFWRVTPRIRVINGYRQMMTGAVGWRTRFTR